MVSKGRKFDSSALAVLPLSPASEERSAVLLDRLLHGVSNANSFAVPADVSPGGYSRYDESKGCSPGERVLLPLDLIADNPHNPRVFFSSEKETSLVRSLRESGQLLPVLVYPINKDGKFVLKSGHRRVRALRAMGAREAKAEIVSAGANPLDEFVQARAINVEQREQTFLDDCVSFKKLLNSGVARTQYQLSAAVGVSEGSLSKYIAIAEMHEDILEKMAENSDKFGMTMAYLVSLAASKWKGDRASVLSLVEKIVEENYSTRQVEALLQKGPLEPSVRRPRSLPLTRSKFSGEVSGELKAFEDRLVLKLHNLTPEARDAVYEAVLSAIQSVPKGGGSAEGSKD